MFLCSDRAFDVLRWAFIALIVAGLPGQALAQSKPEKYSIAVRGLPLSTALEALVSQTEIDLAYDPPLVRGKRANCAAEDLTAEALLRCVLGGTGLDFYRLSSGLYVLIETPETVPLFGGLRGIVVDAETRQPLPRSHVMLADRENGTTANEAGMFAFSRLKPGRYVVIATHVGYEAGATTVDVPPGGDTEAEVALASDPILVQPIVIDGLEWRLPSASLGQATTSQADLLRNPGTGSGDILVGLNSLLGVRVSDATADIHVQGGETGEHQLRLDGAPVFLPLNFATFVGPFSPFAIGSITVHKAGFGASQGSQISGVIDIRHDVNFPERRRFDLQLDPLSANARLSIQTGRRGERHGTFTAASRVSLWDVYSPPALKRLLTEWTAEDPFLYTLFDRSDDNPRFVYPSTTSGNPEIGFRDFHAAGRLRFGLLQSVYGSAYVGQSRLGMDLVNPLAFSPGFASDGEANLASFRDRFNWDTGVAQVRYESVLSSRSLGSVGVRGSYYRVRHDYGVPDSLEVDHPGLELLGIDDNNSIYEVAAEGRIDHALNDRNNLAIGTELVQTGSQFSILGTQRYAINDSSSTWRASLYAEDEVTIGPGLTAEPGARITYLPADNKTYLEPRFSLRLDRARSFLGPFSARASTGLFRQFASQFDVSSRSPRTLLSSTRFWLPADGTVSIPSAVHYSLELLFKPSSAWSIGFEGYYKKQDHLLAIDYASTAGASQGDVDQRDFLRTGSGTVRGAGLQVQRMIGPGRAEVRYEFNYGERKFRQKEDQAPIIWADQTLTTPWNEPHRLELSLDVMPLRNVTLLARWKGIWGRTWGFRRGYYDFVGAFGTLASDMPPDLIPKASRQIERFELDDPDGHRLPPIYQLDLSAAYGMRVADTRLQIRADVLNVFDRRNVSEWHLIFDEETYYQPGEEGGFLLKEEKPLLPRLVSLAVKWTW